jgi:hypothetical protein
MKRIGPEVLMNRVFLHWMILFTVTAGLAQEMRVQDGWVTMDGERFFVKGIGYETHTRPGQAPWIYSFDADLLRNDLSRIRDAGFNTIRTWGALKEEELRIVEESGLKILFGIWIDPAGDFGTASFLRSALNTVDGVLRYSTKYQCIIAYLIMNEPQPEHIHDAGAQALKDLWSAVVDRIHARHPDVPVTFANTMVGDFIDLRMFDLAAYNAYIYNPVTLSASHGYSGYLRFLKKNRAETVPMLVTEFGLSVSPPPAAVPYGYGGNTLEQQASGDLLMLRGVIDAGAQGGCVFQYSDGWFKAGNETVHDNTAEEWFGLIGFSDLKDETGTPRPAWEEFKRYNRAIVTEPKNGAMYADGIPVEVFVTDDVASYSVRWNGAEVANVQLAGRYHADRLNLSVPEDVRDVELEFTFLDANRAVLKTETITCLAVRNTVTMPAIAMQISPDRLRPGTSHQVDLQVAGNPLFTVEKERIDIVCHPHTGWDPGAALTRTIRFTDNKWSRRESFFVPAESRVTTFGAGFTIRYGKFLARITQQNILVEGDWADPIVADDLPSAVPRKDPQVSGHPGRFVLYPPYPNPFNSTVTLRFSLPGPGPVGIRFYDVSGREVDRLEAQFASGGVQEISWNRSTPASGVYFYRLTFGGESQAGKFIVAR